MFKTLTLDIGADGVALASLDLPGQTTNVISSELRDDLLALVSKVKSEAAIRGLVLTSAKSEFVAGGDLKAMVEMFSAPQDAESAYAIATQFSPVLRQLETCGKPVACAINGTALGGGLEIALACHYRAVADKPKLLLGLPESTLGLMPGAGGTQRLPRLIGISKALKMILKGAPMGPADALKLGFVNAVVPADQLISHAREWVSAQEGVVQQPWDRKGFTIPGGAGFFDADISAQYNLTATAVANAPGRQYPAPIAILTSIARGTVLPMDKALHVEACQFAKLVMDPTARNMVRTLFLHKGQLDKLSRRPAGVESIPFRKIGVIGAGLMGVGLAHSAALAGSKVVLIDTTLQQAEAGKQKLSEDFGKRIAKGRMAQDKADTLLASIRPSESYDDLADCDLVVEAVFEDIEVKQAVFRKARAAMRADAILASNTSTLPITELAEGIEQPERFIGLHFFSPVDRMPLVEVIVGAATSDATLAQSLDFIKTLRKTPIVVKDSRGFFTSRIISVYIQEAFNMLGQGVKPALIDNAAKMAGFPMGPLALIDDIGMDNGWKSVQAEQKALGDAWQPGAGYEVQKTFCETLDRRGRRYGKGFYDYPQDKRAVWAGLDEVYPPLAEQPSVEEIQQRLLYIQSVESARCLDEGLVTAAEGDVGSILGIGFPMWTGGVFSLIDTLGLNEFIARCDVLADRYGERFRPSEGLRRRAGLGESFY